jgi:TPR repeat protein
MLDDGGSVMPNLLLALTDPTRGESDWYALALESLEDDVRDGDAQARIMLAIMLERGLGITRNPERAVSLLSQEPRTAEDDYWLGWVFEHRGVFESANRYYTIAARDGISSAFTSLGLLYMDGRGVPANFGTAMALFRVGYDRGDRTAGDLYESFLNSAVRGAALGNPRSIRQLEQFRQTGLREYTMSG